MSARRTRDGANAVSSRPRISATVIAAAVLLAVTVATGLHLGVQTRTQFSAIAADWRGFAEEADRKGALISRIRGHLGYGGIIHSFKNYVLRQEEAYRVQLLEQLNGFDAAISAYSALPATETERAALIRIAATIDLYRNGISVAATAASERWPVERTDALVRVDDSGALAALEALEAHWQAQRAALSERLIASVGRGQALIGVGFASMALLVAASLTLGFAFWTLMRAMRDAMRRLGEELETRRTLERREQRLAEAVEQSPATIVITDTAGKIEYVNRHFEELSGWKRSEIEGLTPRFLQSGDTDAVEYGRMREVLTRGEAWHGVLHNRRKDGGSYWIESTILPLRGAAGATHSYLGIGEDITERLHAREQMVRAQKIEAVGLLAGGIAHDFNSVLTSILGSAHLAALDAPEGSDLGREIEQVEIAARRAQMLVQQLLSFARRRVGNPVPTDLRDSVGQALRLVKAATAPTTCFIYDAEGTPVWVAADPTHLVQIVMNLCGNAAEAIGGVPGTVEITLAHEVGAADGGTPANAVLCVSDDGPGMPEDVRRRVFDAFFTTKPIGKGTGLGLAVVHGLVGDLGGVISVDSTPGAGARFTVRLPLCAAPAVAPGQDAEVAPYGAERLLIVDDEPEIAATLRRSLTRYGYHVEAFTDARAALRSFEAAPERFDAVITDVVMPSLDGVALVDRLRALRPSLSVMFLTGFAPRFEPPPGPAPAILGKPVDPLTLARCLRRHLDAR